MDTEENVPFDEQPGSAAVPEALVQPAAEEAALPGDAVPPPASAASASAKWCIIHTCSGLENKVAESLRTRAEAFGFADKIGQILIPTEEVVEMRNGKKVT